MEYNIINEIEYTVSEEQLSLFTKIVEKVENLLEIKEQYVFSLILVDSARIHEINREYRGRTLKLFAGSWSASQEI